MQHVLIAVVVALLVAACSSGPTPYKPYPVKCSITDLSDPIRCTEDTDGVAK
jgi:hypothetical protein